MLRAMGPKYKKGKTITKKILKSGRPLKIKTILY
tara:strand:- start:22 stop:123 length:102 start_codon:yes stop_codon:yes gene_type:complete